MESLESECVRGKKKKKKVKKKFHSILEFQKEIYFSGATRICNSFKYFMVPLFIIIGICSIFVLSVINFNL